MKRLGFWVCAVALAGTARASEFEIPPGLGAVYWSGLYGGGTQGLVGSGVAELTEKGFQSFKIPLDPSTAPHFGISPGSNAAGFLAYEASTSTFESALGNPGARIIYLAAIDAIVEGLNGAGRQFANQAFLTANASQIVSSYQQLAYYLARTYANTGKEFVLVNWETDNAMYCDSASRFETDANFRATCLSSYAATYGESTPHAAYAALEYWFQLRSEGIAQGVAEAQAQGYGGVSVLSGIELNAVRMVHDLGYPTALYNIVPNSSIAVVGYSAYESTNVGNLATDLPLLQTQVQGRPIGLSEFGFSNQVRYVFQGVSYSAEQAMTVTVGQILQMEAQGNLQTALVWQGFVDSASQQFGVLNDDGSDTPLFEALLSGLGLCVTHIIYGPQWLHAPGHPEQYDDVQGEVTWDGSCVNNGNGTSHATLSNGWQPYYSGSFDCQVSLDYSRCPGAPTSCTTRVTYDPSWLHPPGHPAQYDDVAGEVSAVSACYNSGSASYEYLSNGWVPYFAGLNACGFSFEYTACNPFP
jgi:hypothetical protein